MEPQPMDESLEFIFTSMMHQEDFASAIEFVRSVDSHFIPSQNVMCSIIFHILMKSDDMNSLSQSCSYIYSVIKVYPPKDEDSRGYYLESITEANGYFSDLWNVFCHIVDSYFFHHQIYEAEGIGPESVRYPNCKFLLELFIKLFEVDYEHLTSENYSSALLVHLLWPGGDISKNTRTTQLLKWINDLYSVPYTNQCAFLARSIHDLLSLMVKFKIYKKQELVEAYALNDLSLLEVCEDLANFCKDAYKNLQNFKLFIAFVASPKCLQTRASEKIIRTILSLKQSKSFSILTLREIVNQYMFPSKFNKWKTAKPTNKEKSLRKRAEKTGKMENTVLHKLCEENKFADLMESLKTMYKHINTMDLAGCTPLYKACEAGNYYCVKILKKESGKDSVPKLDYTTSNLEGLTPLHAAVKINSLKIAKLLLESGGSELVREPDNDGRLPIECASSKDMEALLQEYYKSEEVNELSSFIESSQMKEAPTLKSFKEYSIYIHALTFLLCGYSRLYQLYDIAWKKTTFTQNHSEKMCSHFINDNFPCSEDAALLTELPDVIETFIQSLYKNVSKSNISIDLELLPLKAYKTSILPLKQN